MEKKEKRSNLSEMGSSFLFPIVLSIGVIGFVIFKQPLFLIFGALLSALLLIFKK